MNAKKMISSNTTAFCFDRNFNGSNRVLGCPLPVFWKTLSRSDQQVDLTRADLLFQRIHK